MIRTWRTREELLHAVVMMAKQGQSQRAIARALGVSRNTVRVLLDEHAHERVVEHSSVSPPPTRAPRPSKLDAFKPRFGELLVRFPNITAQRVFEILKDEGFMGGSTAVKNHMRVVRPPARPTPRPLSRSTAAPPPRSPRPSCLNRKQCQLGSSLLRPQGRQGSRPSTPAGAFATPTSWVPEPE